MSANTRFGRKEGRTLVITRFGVGMRFSRMPAVSADVFVHGNRFFRNPVCMSLTGGLAFFLFGSRPEKFIKIRTDHLEFLVSDFILRTLKRFPFFG